MKRTGMKTRVKVEGDRFSKPRIEQKNNGSHWCGNAHRELRDRGETWLRYGYSVDRKRGLCV